jgi:hypothetical protein
MRGKTVAEIDSIPIGLGTAITSQTGSWGSKVSVYR